jgi:hypothetical protein
MILIALVNLAQSYSFTYDMCDKVFNQFIETDVPAWYNALGDGQYPGTQAASIPAGDYLGIATAVLGIVAAIPEMLPGVALLAPLAGVSHFPLYYSF